MRIPDCYQLRADYTFMPDTSQRVDDWCDINKQLTRIASERFTIRQISAGNALKTIADQPIFSVHINRDANLVRLSAYSSSVSREELLEEALSLLCIVKTLFSFNTGILIDHLAQSSQRLEQQSIASKELTMSDLYQVHVVSLADHYFLHSHGLVKFACPDFQWYMPRHAKPELISSLFKCFIVHAIKNYAGQTKEMVLTWQGYELQFILKNTDIQDMQHNGLNRVIGISIKPGQETPIQHINSIQESREAYFYGREQSTTK